MHDETPEFDAFISYAKADQGRAQAIVASLEARGLRCWIAPRDVRKGRKYAAEILRGIEKSRSFVLVLSQAANGSRFVCKEVERAISKGKHVFTIRVEDVGPSDELELFISDTQWTDAWSGDLHEHVEPLAEMLIADAAAEAPDSGAKGKAPKTKGGRTRKDDGASGAYTLLKTRIEPVPAPKPRSLRPWLVAGSLAAALLVGGIALYRWLPPAESETVTAAQLGPAPQWALNTTDFIGRPILLEWTYGKPALFEIESARDRGFTDDRRKFFAEGDHRSIDEFLDEARFWRLRAVVDDTTQAPESAWSEVKSIGRYGSAFDRIKATGEVKAYISNSPDQGVFKWRDKTTGMQQGFDIKLAKLVTDALAQELRRTLSFKPIQESWENLLEAPREERADFAISSITKTDEREKKYGIKFSRPYFCTTFAVMFKGDAADGADAGTMSDMLAGKIVGAQDGTTGGALVEALAEDERINAKLYDSTSKLVDALGREIDYGLTDATFADAVKLRYGLNLREFGPEDFPASFPEKDRTQYYAIAVREGEDRLLGAIDGVIATAQANGLLVRLLDDATKEYEATLPGAGQRLGVSRTPWECFAEQGGGAD